MIAIERGTVIRYVAISRGVGKRQVVKNRKEGKRVLWIGQPEYDDCIETLKKNVILLFKAHPRDQRYRNNKYSDLMSNSDLKTVDVSQYDFGKCIALYPDAVITQYSSMAIEMEFYRIPFAYLLFPDAEGVRLYDMCSYHYPELCSKGVAVLINDKRTKGSVKLINNDHDRKQMMINFDSYFQGNSV